MSKNDSEAKRQNRERPENEPSDKADGLLTEELRMVRVAKSILRHRRRRTEYFSCSIFNEAGWDVLLQLYVRDSSGGSATVAQLLRAAGTQMSSAARWLDHLEAEGLVARRAHPREPGTEFIELTEKAWQAMEAYLSAVRGS